MEIYTPADGSLLYMVSRFPQLFDRKCFNKIDKRLHPVCKFFTTLKCSPSVNKKYGEFIHALAKDGGIITVKESKDGGLVGKHKYQNLL